MREFRGELKMSIVLAYFFIEEANCLGQAWVVGEMDRNK